MKKSAGFWKKIADLGSMANHDFCPWANRYVYWLKQPVGWFVVATGASLLVGAFLNPLGWTVAFGLVGILVLGLGFPWIAVRSVQCQLSPMASEIHERQSSYLELKVVNRLPVPIFGLLIEGYLTQCFTDEAGLPAENCPDVGLAAVPALSEATYRLAIRPEYRGRYPIRPPQVACAFPFGIWKARRPLTQIKPITVWPLVFRSTSEFEVSGNQIADIGSGNRPSSHGEFLGVREFRRGDSLRSIHWVQTARLDNLIVCERGGPQKQAIDLYLTTERCQGSSAEARENLAWRVRIMASLIDLAVSRHVPFRLYIDGKLQMVSQGSSGLTKAWRILTDIPLDSDPHVAGVEERDTAVGVAGASTFVSVGASQRSSGDLAAHLVRVQVQQSSGSLRNILRLQSSLIDLDLDIGQQVNQLLTEASRESRTA